MTVAANNQVFYGRQGWKFYIAYLNDEPAATAVMYINNGIASLTFAATLPEFRGNGLHQNENWLYKNDLEHKGMKS